MVVIVRLDLDKYDLNSITRLYQSGVITLGEASESRVYKEMSEVEQLKWARKNQAIRELLAS